MPEVAMSSLNSVFRFILEVQGAVVEGVTVNRRDPSVEIHVRRHANAKPRCPRCKAVLGGDLREVEVRWRHLDLMRCRCYLVAKVREGHCAEHGRRYEEVPWAKPRAKHTRAFDRQVAILVQVADKTAAGRMFRIAWRTAGRMVSRVVGELLPKNLLDGLVGIGVDETSYKRGHRYLTVVSCLTTSRVIWVGQGKTAETLASFFQELGPERASKLLAVSMDMSVAYTAAVQEHAPQAKIIYDRFHVIQLLTKAIDEIRREECRKLYGDERKALKGIRFALLRHPDRLDERDEAKIALVAAGNLRLFRAYQRRVSFEHVWLCEDEDAARSFLKDWTRSALLSRIEPLRKFARTIRTHIEGILGFFRWGGQTNAHLEGICNKVKLVIHRAYGFHNVGSLIAMVHLCCSGLVIPE